jgi:hypothetical protein
VAGIYGYFALLIALMAAAFACAGFVRSIYLVRISSSVSISSSCASYMVANGVVLVILDVFATCAVGVVSYPFECALFT